jgi:sigma-E factor negative regulatory protein RseA
MSEERQSERDSQISAMFDGELSSAECELLARRLARDEALRGQWSRYALIGAAVRAERGVKLDDRVARRVQSSIAQEASYGDAASADGAMANGGRAVAAAQSDSSGSFLSERWMRFARPLAGASIAAGVAAVSILWLRTGEPDSALLANTPVTESIVLEPEPVSTTLAAIAPQPEAESISNGEPERYSTPAPSSQTGIAPPARLANYVVAHSEYSGPLTRRMALLGIVGTESQAEGDDNATGEEANRAGAADAP